MREMSDLEWLFGLGSNALEQFYSRISHSPLLAQIGLVASLWAIAISSIYAGAACFGWWGWRDRRGWYGLLLGIGVGFAVGSFNVLLILNFI